MGNQNILFLTSTCMSGVNDRYCKRKQYKMYFFCQVLLPFWFFSLIVWVGEALAWVKADASTTLAEVNNCEWNEERCRASVVSQVKFFIQQGGSAVDAVEAAVRNMEDNPLFNAGRGCALTEENTAELDALIMDGHSLAAGETVMLKLMLFSFWKMHSGPVACAAY